MLQGKARAGMPRESDKDGAEGEGRKGTCGGVILGSYLEQCGLC